MRTADRSNQSDVNDPSRNFRALICCAAQPTCCCARLRSSADGEHELRRRGTIIRKPAKTRHSKTAKPVRTNARTATRPASSTVADLQERVSALTRELAESARAADCNIRGSWRYLKIAR